MAFALLCLFVLQVIDTYELDHFVNILNME